MDRYFYLLEFTRDCETKNCVNDAILDTFSSPKNAKKKIELSLKLQHLVVTIRYVIL